ncbi:hypothetical protein Y032_0276g1088 [Ancylostoma ceylanicum]|uniref:Uncharacterized protein n=1 Tax=Ancylostoma ceylanicum TaxID=53326 RepID=A0A016S836_9BILA|nr:hypothetical protein Y032_0276g1088 [Ancylostoma ceylanicum]
MISVDSHPSTSARHHLGSCGRHSGSCGRLERRGLPVLAWSTFLPQAVRRKGTDATIEEMPLWAERLIERFDHFSTSLERSLTDSFERIFGELASIHRTQSTILTRLSELEKKVSCKEVPGNDQQNLLYSTLVKIQTDGELINEKSRRIAWIGIDEQIDEESTRRFDHDIVKEAVYTSRDQELIREFEERRIVSHRHPPGKPRGPAARGRIIKIALSS